MHLLTRVLVAAAFLLLIAGGLVTSTGSGLAVPDWPLSYGRLMPPMVGGILYEHGHRMIATTVGVLALILTVWIGVREPRRWVRGLAIAAFGAVVVQGILGGLTVLWHLPTPISIAHACLGQTVFVLVVLLATIYGERGEQPAPGVPARGVTRAAAAQAERARSPSLSEGERGRASQRRSASLGPIERCCEWSSPKQGMARVALFTTVAIYVQLILGAALRHAGWQPTLVAAHLLGALATVACILWTAWVTFWHHTSDNLVTRRALWLVGLTLVQVGLGLVAWVGHRPVWAATAHVAVGALLLANAAVLTWHACRGQISGAHRAGAPVQWTGRGGPSRAGDGTSRFSVYLELTKPRLTLLAAITTLVGFYLGSQGPLSINRLVVTLAGTLLLGGGAGALNQYLERAADARMSRTRHRPIPDGRITPRAAWRFGTALVSVGLALLAVGVNGLTAALGLATLISYLGLYTPLKTRTTLCTLVGAIPGAMPPLMGWAAARGTLEPGAWALFALVFLWQLPHFLALAWLHQEDYARAGFRMLPVIDPVGEAVGRQIALYCLALVPVSLAPTVLAVTGGVYFFGALTMGLAFLGIGVRAAITHTPVAARHLFRASLAYLPGVLTAMALDKVTL